MVAFFFTGHHEPCFEVIVVRVDGPELSITQAAVQRDGCIVRIVREEDAEEHGLERSQISVHGLEGDVRGLVRIDHRLETIVIGWWKELRA